MCALDPGRDGGAMESDRTSTSVTHAVVIGASIAGLAIAAALRSRFERVTVIDRDELPSGAAQRKGVPQGRHLHVLLRSGADALDELFPGLGAELVADGAERADLGRHGRTAVNGYVFARGPFGFEDLLASRSFIEGHVRRRVQADAEVDIRDRVEVEGLVADPVGRVSGVKVTSRDGAGPEVLAADLVVDCSGRSSRASRWLEDLGFDAPEIEELRVDVRYATRHYRIETPALDGDRLALVTPAPALPRGGGACAEEDGRWVVTLIGMGGQQVPLVGEEFESYAATLPAALVHEVLLSGEPLDEPVGYRFASNLRRRYERVRRLPDGLLVAGDAVCSFNPIYGQGMSVAALEAVALRQLLATGEVPSPQRWFATIAPIIDTPWELAVGGDLAIDCIEGHRRVTDRLVNRYMDRYYRAAVVRPDLAALFARVSSLVEPPGRLLQPGVAARVVRHGRRRRTSHADTGVTTKR
jgi:2-polyprenyl-6-methoxyphenol hydroxylase-like FAD-dependent oxidoreductase